MNQTTIRLKGRCLCGAVAVEAREANTHFHACHCAMCQKWGGGPTLSIECGGDVSFDGEDNITTFTSSPWAERGFCRTCGTHLFFRTTETVQYYMPLGVFDDIPDVTMEQQLFIDKKPSYYAFTNETKNLTEADVIALYAEEP